MSPVNAVSKHSLSGLLCILREDDSLFTRISHNFLANTHEFLVRSRILVLLLFSLLRLTSYFFLSFYPISRCSLSLFCSNSLQFGLQEYEDYEVTSGSSQKDDLSFDAKSVGILFLKSNGLGMERNCETREEFPSGIEGKEHFVAKSVSP